LGHRFTLRQRLILLTMLALLPAFLIVLYQQVTARAQRLAEVEDYALGMTDAVESEFRRGLTAAAILMIAIGESLDWDDWDGAVCEERLTRLQTQLPTLSDLVVMDAAGGELCRWGALDESTVERIFGTLGPRVPEERFPIGGYIETGGRPALPVLTAFMQADGTVGGYILIAFTLEELDRVVEEQGLPAGSSLTVADREGMVLFRHPATEGREPGDLLPEGLRERLSVGEGGTLRVANDDGQRMVAGFRTSAEGLPVSILFRVPEAQALAPVRRATLVGAGIAGIGALAAVLFALAIGRAFIQRPVDRLLGALDARRAGDAGARVALQGDASEFGTIGRAVDALFDELDRREAAQREAEESRDLMAREIQHRVKNLLAVVQAIARQTLARNREAAPEVAAFGQRIDAIVRAHTTLLSPESQGGDLREVIAGALKPFLAEPERQLRLDGPPMRVSPKAGLALTLAFHELATNAAKHGALSVPEGRVAATWRAADGEFALDWREEGGPPAADPERTGFGTLLLRRVLEGETRGRVSTRFGAQGFAFDLRAPLDRLAA
jgi:two-component sensor histidine kinase